MRYLQIAVVMVCLVLIGSVPLAISGTGKDLQGESKRPGVEPSSKQSCPNTHPIKGNFTTRSGERCIFHMPGQRFYLKTHPERCYATPEEAQEDGCRQSKV